MLRGARWHFIREKRDVILKLYVRFPSHEQIGGASKIPTVIYYDQAGNIRAAGAETTCEGILERAEDEGWVKSEWCARLQSWGIDAQADRLLQRLGSNCILVTSLRISLLFHLGRRLCKSLLTSYSTYTNAPKPTSRIRMLMGEIYGIR